MDWITNNLGILASALILALSLALGRRDAIRFSAIRTWAIAGVCFRQSIRRRVLLLTPVVVIGIVIVSQFQKALDARDATRQTTVYCLFATGMLVTVVSLMLACTNLPKEIESRVIYTIATKPTTRLEIVLGKIIGFAGISACILLIMGIFTWGYLKFRDWREASAIDALMTSPDRPTDPATIATLLYYHEHGTLHARKIGLPINLGMYARRPAGPDDRWVAGGAGGSSMMGLFVVPRSFIPPPQSGGRPLPSIGPGLLQQTGGIIVKATIKVRPAKDIPATDAAARQPMKPSVAIDLRDGNGEMVVPSTELGTNNVSVPEGGGDVQVLIPHSLLQKVIPAERDKVGVFFVAIRGASERFEYTSTLSSWRLMIADTGTVLIPPKDGPPLLFVGSRGQFGQRLIGRSGGGTRVAVYEFREQSLDDSERFSFEFRARFETAPDTDDAGAPPRLEVEFVEPKTGKSLHTTSFSMENNIPTYFDVPAAALNGGDFDAILRLATSGQVSLRTPDTSSLKLVRGAEPFVWNLSKSLLVLWMLSLLVTIISVFCSTFLSWPIAVVLTLILLAGRWGILQVGDLATGNIGAQFTNELFRGADAGKARVISNTVEGLVKSFVTVSSILPDISQYAAIEYIERGVAMPASAMKAAVCVTLLFGLPITALAWLLLKCKEVAP